jgi:hypothetical protein
MTTDYKLGYNDGVSTTIKFLKNMAHDFTLLEGEESPDADYLKEIIEALKEKYID